MKRLAVIILPVLLFGGVGVYFYISEDHINEGSLITTPSDILPETNEMARMSNSLDNISSLMDQLKTGIQKSLDSNKSLSTRIGTLEKSLLEIQKQYQPLNQKISENSKAIAELASIRKQQKVAVQRQKSRTIKTVELPFRYDSYNSWGSTPYVVLEVSQGELVSVESGGIYMDWQVIIDKPNSEIEFIHFESKSTHRMPL